MSAARVRATIARSALGLTLGVVALTNVGCGLLFVPYVSPLPPEEFRKVDVRDAQTGSPLQDASVWAEFRAYRNWVLFSDWGTFAPGDEGSPASQPYPGVRSEPLEVAETAPGSFQIEPVNRWSWVRVWIPLPPVLGPWYYETYEVVISASAPGFRTLWFNQWAPCPCEADANEMRDGAAYAGRVQMERRSDGLRVYLHPVDAAPGTFPNGPVERGSRDHREH